MTLASTGQTMTHRARMAAAMLAGALVMVPTGLVSTAAAAPAIGCGTTITKTTTLTADIGPCPGTGLVIAADNITVDLNGHRVSGNPGARGSGPDQAGVVLRQVHGVTLMNGTVRGFDAGVLIGGGGRNTISHLRAVDNVNYRVVTGRNALPGSPGSGLSCDLGDGIAVLGSNQNRLANNTLRATGPTRL